jgi:hypothetical protein
MTDSIMTMVLKERMKALIHRRALDSLLRRGQVNVDQLHITPTAITHL